MSEKSTLHKLNTRWICYMLLGRLLNETELSILEILYKNEQGLNITQIKKELEQEKQEQETKTKIRHDYPAVLKNIKQIDLLKMTETQLNELEKLGKEVNFFLQFKNKGLIQKNTGKSHTTIITLTKLGKLIVKEAKKDTMQKSIMKTITQNTNKVI